MYIWKISPLVQALKSEELSQKEQFKYFLTYSILMLLATDPYLYSDFKYVVYDTVDTVIMLLITIFGLIYCYKINESIDGKDFILRFMILGLPIMVRFLVISISIVIVYYAFTDTSDTDVITTQPVDVVFSAIFMAGYYYYFSRVLKGFAK